jgi:DNA mismatch repair protein MSH5
MDNLLTQVATQLSKDLPEWASRYVENCIFFPQLGFLAVVPLDPETGKGKFEGEGIDDDIWIKHFVSNDMGYYKNKRMREMDDYFGDMYGIICGKPMSPYKHFLTDEAQIERSRSFMPLLWKSSSMINS